MTLNEALALARDLKYGPLPRPDDPTLTVQEALAEVLTAQWMRP